MEKAKVIWMDGKFVPRDNAKIHILSHAIHYGTSVFEGLRCYKNKKGVETVVATWQRMAPNIFPAMDKAGENYMNSQLMKMEAILRGVTEGIALDVFGYVSEGSGENFFCIKVGNGRRGPITKKLQEEFYKITAGKDKYNWLTWV